MVFPTLARRRLQRGRGPSDFVAAARPRFLRQARPVRQGPPVESGTRCRTRRRPRAAARARFALCGRRDPAGDHRGVVPDPHSSADSRAQEVHADEPQPGAAVRWPAGGAGAERVEHARPVEPAGVVGRYPPEITAPKPSRSTSGSGAARSGSGSGSSGSGIRAPRDLPHQRDGVGTALVAPRHARGEVVGEAGVAPVAALEVADSRRPRVQRPQGQVVVAAVAAVDADVRREARAGSSGPPAVRKPVSSAHQSEVAAANPPRGPVARPHERKTSRPAIRSSSASWQPVWPLPTSTGPGGRSPERCSRQRRAGHPLRQRVRARRAVRPLVRAAADHHGVGDRLAVRGRRGRTRRAPAGEPVHLDALVDRAPKRSDRARDGRRGRRAACSRRVVAVVGRAGQRTSSSASQAERVPARRQRCATWPRSSTTCPHRAARARG